MSLRHIEIPTAALVRRVRAALKQSKGSVPGAASILGVGASTLYTWLRELPSLDGLDAPRAKPGRPRKSDVGRPNLA